MAGTKKRRSNRTKKPVAPHRLKRLPYPQRSDFGPNYTIGSGTAPKFGFFLQKEEILSCSFLEKRTKKLLLILPAHY
jgi:hypothetical protein